MLLPQAAKQINRPIVLSEQVTTILQKAIFDGSIKEGEQLVEAELQLFLSVSRSPLREAFRELERRGFIEIIPRRGAFVKGISEKDMIDNAEVRSNLEVLSATSAYRRTRDTVFEKMSKIFVQMEKAVKTQDIEMLTAVHMDFHNSYIHESGNEVLKKFLEILYFRTSWYHSYFYNCRSEYFEGYLLSHEIIMSQFGEPDIRSKDLERVIRKHINNGFKEYLSAYNVISEK
ncbi:MAG: GntR family transcriptional regulator [Deltaproteobacteria bacterium]|nr:GntR family transcriptional regulator [Deltaproteobacteria bacterium]